MKPTFAPLRLLGVSFNEEAVIADVTLAVNIAMVIRPNVIQIIEKIRATTDFGDLSP